MNLDNLNEDRLYRQSKEELIEYIIDLRKKLDCAKSYESEIWEIAEILKRNCKNFKDIYDSD